MYGVIITIIALFFARRIFRIFIQYSSNTKFKYSLKWFALFFSIAVWLITILVFWWISWKFPIDDDLWQYFAGLHIISIWLTLIISLKDKNKR